MSNLKHITRNGVNPQGIPKIYFCCHPDDLEHYLKDISKDILRHQNCSIWYTDDRDACDEFFFNDLSLMQLFVIPITKEFLSTDNEALNTDFKFAIQNNIPVLPILLEKNLNNLFNEKCGNLQYLDKYNTDTTSISYDEKLKNYLQSVLIGDELAERIRNAFDAYIFLSYRKKDRKYAQELMRLIHKNDFCRDIAIWYDEFLIPGENFNDAIKKAIKKSDLFVLTVTPNVVNETNYIMTTEYPLAKQEGKSILPAEMMPTDRKLLSEKFEDITTLIKANNEIEFSYVLQETIKRIATKETDTSPEHIFLIGLAYLGGIDVEINLDRAFSLISIAAENLEDAKKQLITMYKKGIGTSINYEKAIYWQRRLIKDLFYSFKSMGSYANFDKLDTEIQMYIAILYEDRTKFKNYCAAIKTIMDYRYYISEISTYIYEILKYNKISFNTTIPCDILEKLEISEDMLKRTKEISSKLQILTSKFFSLNHRRFYHDVKTGLNKNIDLNQVVMRYILAYFSEYSGNEEEARSYRDNAYKILKEYASINNEDLNFLYETYNITPDKFKTYF